MLSQEKRLEITFSRPPVLYFMQGTICLNLEAGQKGNLGAHLGGSFPHWRPRYMVSACSLLWQSHRKPTNWKLQSPINKVISKDPGYQCYVQRYVGLKREESFTFCLFYLLVMLGAEIGRKGAISQPLLPLQHPPHCYFTLKTKNLSHLTFDLD